MGEASKQYVFFFGAGRADGRAEMEKLLGDKGVNLAEMSRLQLPVPSGFTLSTEVCRHYIQHGEYPDALQKQVEATIAQVEAVMGLGYGDPQRPLLLSVRPGAPVAMPGMMDTVLNLGCNDATVQGLIEQTDSPRFAYDCYRRFLQDYGDVVLDLRPHNKHESDVFDELLEQRKHDKGVERDAELSADDWAFLINAYKAVAEEWLGFPYPQDPREQLWQAINAVFRSWNSERAVTYRRLHDIPDDLGTAVHVQAMVYGNINDQCATGVAFTRNPIYGQHRVYGEYLLNAQGEDLVAGVCTPAPLSHTQNSGKSGRSLEQIMPEPYQQLLAICQTLEAHYRDMQDVEFTIQNGQLWVLRSQAGARTSLAAVRIAVEMVESGLIDRDTALIRVDPHRRLNQLLLPSFSLPAFAAESLQQATAEGRRLTAGLVAGPGAATGRIVFSTEDAVAWAKRGEPVILVRHETSPEDISGMAAAAGILTARGGSTSYASLIARQMSKVCVVGCRDINIDYANQQMTIHQHTLRQGDYLSLDGFLGHVYQGHLDTHLAEISQILTEHALDPEDVPNRQIFARLAEWAKEARLR